MKVSSIIHSVLYTTFFWLFILTFSIFSGVKISIPINSPTIKAENTKPTAADVFTQAENLQHN